MEDNTWQLQDAKSKFSQLVDKAIHHQPQIVTKYGHKAVVILAFDEYNSMTKPSSDLVSFFRDSPLLNSNLDLSRSNDLPRDIKL